MVNKEKILRTGNEWGSIKNKKTKNETNIYFFGTHLKKNADIHTEILFLSLKMFESFCFLLQRS